MLKSHCFQKISVNKNILVDGNYTPVRRVFIQGEPGTIFTINKGGNIELTDTGVYELDLLTYNLGYILDITFITIANNENLSVEIIYEEV